eukprot:403371914
MCEIQGITHILQVAAGFQPFFPGQFKYKVINVLDMPFENLGRYFQSGINFIKQAIASGGSVLVHCYAGISRSASIVIAYLMQEMEMPMYNAMTFTRQRRPIIFPNPGFQKQLIDFEKSLKITKKHRSGEKTNASAPTVQSSTNQNYQNFSEKITSLGHKHQHALSPQKQKNLIEKVYASPVSKNLMHQQKEILIESKYVSQSADKGGKNFQSRLQYDEQKNKQIETMIASGYSGRQTQNNNQNQRMQQERAHTSKAHNRRGIENEAVIKQELMNRINNINLQGNNPTYQKQSRAKSSYGSKNQYQNHPHMQSSHKQRNISEHTLPLYQNTQDGQSLDPSQAYFQQSQNHIHSKFNQSTKQNSTISQSFYNSIQKGQKQESTESLTGNNRLQESLGNLQYFCDHCSIPLFNSNDLVDHSQGSGQQTNLTQRSQLKLANQYNNHHQSKFSLSSNQYNQQPQIFGKTFTDMSNGHQQHKCGSLFIKRKEWIQEQDGNEGNIVCPRKSCAVKIGSYCWQGTRCSTCGQFVSPAFQIFRNRIKYRFSDENILATSDAKNYQKVSQKQLLVRTPDQKRKNPIGDHFHQGLNFSFTADSKKSQAKSRRQNSNIEDLTRLKQGYQGLVQSIQQTQILNNQQNASQKSKNQAKQLMSSDNYGQRESVNNINHAKSNHQQLRNKSSNHTQNSTGSSMGQSQGGMKSNLNNLYHQLMLEQERKVKQGNNLTGYKQNNYQSPSKISQIKK